MHVQAQIRKEGTTYIHTSTKSKTRHMLELENGKHPFNIKSTQDKGNSSYSVHKIEVIYNYKLP